MAAAADAEGKTGLARSESLCCECLGAGANERDGVG